MTVFGFEVTEDVIAFVCFIIATIFSIVNFFRTGRLSKSAKQFICSEVNELKKDTSNYSQSFSEEITDYILNPVTNELEVSPVPKNIQKYIDSYIDVALDRVLERFLPEQVIEDKDDVADYTQMQEDLAYMGDVFELAEDYRDKFGLDNNMSVQDIFRYVGTKSNELGEKLKNIGKKEIVENEETQETK